MAIKPEPRTGPSVRPSPSAISRYPTYVEVFLGNSIVTSAKLAVVIKASAIPCTNLTASEAMKAVV